MRVLFKGFLGWSCLTGSQKFVLARVMRDDVLNSIKIYYFNERMKLLNYFVSYVIIAKKKK